MAEVRPGQGRDGDARASNALRQRLRPRHQLKEPDRPPDQASDGEIVALLGACLSARDRLIVLLLSRAGLRSGEVAGLRRSDLHTLPDNRVLGCAIEGADVQVIRRGNANGACSAICSCCL